MPTVPFGSEAVVTVTGAATVRFNVTGAEVADFESVAVTVTGPLKAAVGVPVMVLPLTVSPAGRPVALKVYGPVPPLAAKGAV